MNHPLGVTEPKVGGRVPAGGQHDLGGQRCVLSGEVWGGTPSREGAKPGILVEFGQGC